MIKRVTMVFELDQDEYDEFLEREEVAGDLREWAFAEICQNQDFGFLTNLKVEDVED